jgi:hypothetical protein
MQLLRHDRWLPEKQRGRESKEQQAMIVAPPMAHKEYEE